MITILRNNLYSTNNNKILFKQNKNIQTNNNIINNNNKQKIYAHNLNNIHFGKKNINQLYEEYNWYINHDHTPAINSFLKIDADEKTMDSFLTAILNTEDRSYQFIDSLVRQPRKMPELTNELIKKVGPQSKNVMPFFFDSPYNKAYNKYIDKKYNDSHTISELLKVRPDWKGSVLLEKHKQLKGNESFEIGNIPKEFPNNHLFLIADYLKDKMEIGLKQNKKIANLKLDNREYEFKFFTEGKSDKNVFGVFTPERKKYVLKMSDEKYRSLDNPFALGTLAKIDTFLTTNRSRNSAPLCYYNHDKNMSVYKYIEHIHVPQKTNNLCEISEHLPDFKALGLTYNDNVGDKNYFQLKMNSNEDLHNTEGFSEAIMRNEWISVDNDHVTFNNKFQPSVSKYHAPLPNAMQMFF